MLELSFGDVEPQEMIPEGFYEVTVEDLNIDESKATPGNRNLVLSLRIIGPDEVDAGLIGRKFREVVSLASSSRWKLQIILEAITGMKWREDGMQLDPRDLVGMNAKVVIFHNPNKNGKIYANVQSWHPWVDKD